MPRIAAAFAWLGVIAIALATNISRYPLVTQMAAKCVPGGCGGIVKSRARRQRARANSPPRRTSRQSRHSRQSASPRRQYRREEPASTSASPAAFSPQMTPIDDAPPAAAVDPLDLGNGVRRLPPVD